MDRRTRILASIFGGMILYALISGVAYPRWIEPLLTIDQRIAQRQEVLEDLQKRQDAVDHAKEEYRGLVARVGSFDIGEVENDVRERLSTLIDKHGFADASVSRGRTTRDRRTELQWISITVTATAKLESAIGFVKELAQLPHLMRVGNLKISPASSRRREEKSDRMNVTIPIKLMVPPRNRLVGRITEAELVQPESFVRHENRRYAVIWERKPFSEYVPPVPLRANAGGRVVVQVGAAATLPGSARGGDGAFTYAWTPPEGLNDAAAARPQVLDTSTAGERNFTLTVTDGGGASATATVTLMVQEQPPEKPAEPSPPPRTVTDRRWKDRKRMQLCMAMKTSTGDSRLDEAMIYDQKAKTAKFYRVGDDFDGGQLVFVHQTGVLVRRQNDYVIYPIGADLDQDIAVERAADFPELVAAAGLVRAAREAALRSEQESGQPEDVNGAAGQEADGARAGEADGVEEAEAKRAETEQAEATGAGSQSARDKDDPKRRRSRRNRNVNRRRPRSSGRANRP